MSNYLVDYALMTYRKVRSVLVVKKLHEILVYKWYVLAGMKETDDSLTVAQVLSTQNSSRV